jgi:hypothetical protein
MLQSPGMQRAGYIAPSSKSTFVLFVVGKKTPLKMTPNTTEYWFNKWNTLLCFPRSSANAASACSLVLHFEVQQLFLIAWRVGKHGFEGHQSTSTKKAAGLPASARVGRSNRLYTRRCEHSAAAASSSSCVTCRCCFHRSYRVRPSQK